VVDVAEERVSAAPLSEPFRVVFIVLGHMISPLRHLRFSFQ